MKLDSQPLVSVVIPCYNHEKFVQECIQSVIDQTYNNIELIIIDDGSKDDSVIKIQEMIGACEQRFTRFEFRTRPNKGLSATLNEALEWCCGKYYGAIASDDLMHKNNIEFKVNILNKPSTAPLYGVFSGFDLIDENGKVFDHYTGKYGLYDFESIIMHRHTLPAPTALLDLAKVREVGGYDSRLKIEDWFMWLRLTEHGGKLMYIPQILCQYRSHGSNFSKNRDVMDEERIKVLSFFKHTKQYESALKNVQWYTIVDQLDTDRRKSLLEAFKQIKTYPKELFSRNFIRFLYYIWLSYSRPIK